MPGRSSKPAGSRAVAEAVRRPRGQPYVKYSEALAQEVCERIARGEVWSRIGGTGGMPRYSTLFYWKRTRPEFAEAYALARAAATETRADEVLAIAMEATRETLQEDRFLVGSLKWHVARADRQEAKSNDWTLGNSKRLVIRIRQFERAYLEDGTPYVREVAASVDAVCEDGKGKA